MAGTVTASNVDESRLPVLTGTYSYASISDKISDIVLTRPTHWGFYAAFAFCTALTLLFATFVTSEQQAGSLLNLILLVLAPLGGAWWPLEITPTWMQTIGHVSPVAWVMEGFRSVIFRSGGLNDVVMPVLVMLGFTAVFFVLATRRIPKVIGV